MSATLEINSTFSNKIYDTSCSQDESTSLTWRGLVSKEDAGTCLAEGHRPSHRDPSPALSLPPGTSHTAPVASPSAHIHINF